MGQKLKVIARTIEVPTDDNEKIITKDIADPKTILNDMTIFGGKMSGICYMPDDYLSNGIQNENSALIRSNNNRRSGHYSVFEHGTITFLLETNKMMAMILNSLNIYATSEKSARYTTMKAKTEKEQINYEKWKNIFSKIIGGYYSVPDGYEFSPRVNDPLKKSDKEIHKLAQENARYMLSVFTPTIMSYTISFKQAIMVGQWLYKLSSILIDNEFKEMKSDVIELADLILDAIGIDKDDILLKDHKNQYIRFIADNYFYNDKKEVIGDSYTLNYECSLACLAQAERHRSLRYSFNIRSLKDKRSFYVPEIIRNTPYEKEWRYDLNMYDSTVIPQATLVHVTEQGLFEDFYLKCLERLCSRAQLEIQRLTQESVLKFNNERSNLYEPNKRLLEKLINRNDCTVNTRCGIKDYVCKEPCAYGSNGLNRNI